MWYIINTCPLLTVYCARYRVCSWSSHSWWWGRGSYHSVIDSPPTALLIIIRFIVYRQLHCWCPFVTVLVFDSNQKQYMREPFILVYLSMPEMELVLILLSRHYIRFLLFLLFSELSSIVHTVWFLLSCSINDLVCFLSLMFVLKSLPFLPLSIGARYSWS